MASAQKKTAFQILAFLQQSLQDGSIKQDDAEGIEVASQCISEAFGVDLDKPEDQKAYSIAPDTLVSILDSHKAASAPSTSAPKEVTPEAKALAEKAKGQGNALMAKKDYPASVAAYGTAIEHDPSNPVYYSNRAAAHSQLGDHDKAIADGRKALEIDPSFSKAYSRLGHALFSSGQYSEAVNAYEKGLELDPNNATMKSSLSTARSRVVPDEDDEEEAGDSVTSRGAAGGGGFPGMGAGGMPDLAGMMNNPAIMQMAQQMMQNGGLEQLMQNPMLQSMMNGAGGAGGMPDIGALMNDPTMRAMAEQFGRGAGGRGSGSGSGSGNGGNDSMYS